MLNLVKSNVVSYNKDKEEITLKTDNHTFGLTPAFTKFSPDLFQILDTGDYDRAKIPAIQNYLDNLINNGIVDGTRCYNPLFDGSSNRRNGCYVNVEENNTKDFFNWATIGIDLKDMPVSKIAKYIGLMFSTVKSWENIFPNNGLYETMSYPHPSTWGIFSDISVPAIGLFNCVNPNGTELKLYLQQDKEENKITDGVAYYVINDLSLSDHQRKELIKKIEAFTIRAPFVKGLVVPILLSALIKFFKNHPELSPIIKDAWGNKRNLLELKVITFKSVFKAWKCVANWEEYVERFDSYNHQVWVCVKAHGTRWASMPYQQLQTLNAYNEEIESFARLSYNFLLDNSKIGKIGKIIGGNLGKLVDLYPNLLSDDFVKEQLQRSWASRCKQMFGGRILHVSHNLFCAPDTIAVLEGLCGTKVNGVLPANKVHTASFSYNKKLGCTRCPHLDHAWATPINIDVPGEYRGFYLGTTIFYSANDNTMKLHQMDFDGDHSNVTDNPLLIEVAERSHEEYRDHCLLYAAMDDGNKQSGCKDYEQEFKELCRNAFKAPIGLYANTITKLWALKPAMLQNTEAARRLWIKLACLTRKGNTCIDEAGGHGKDTSIGIAEDAVNEFMIVKKPNFLRYAKGTINQDGEIVPVQDDRHEFKPTHTVDLYSALCRFMVPEHAQDVIDLSKVGPVNTLVFMSAGMSGRNLRKRLTGLIGDRDCMFNQLVVSAASEEQLIAESSSLKVVPDFKLDKAEMIELKIAEYALDHGCTLDDAIDLIAFNLFYKTKNNTPIVAMLKRWFFIAFGDRLIANVLKNKDVELGDIADYEEDDEEE